MNVLDVNTVNLRNAYPTALGKTIGQNGTSSNQTNAFSRNTAEQSVEDNSDVLKAVSIGGQSSAIIGGLVFLGLLLGLMFLAKRLGTDSDFAGIKPSAYNVLTISLAAIVGLPVWKYLVTRFPIPGVSTWVLSA